ncbi:hypothetical protein [Bradyrhizobium elkanii]|nr:hypothetical protein [Bradyrhizobium elkanii]MCP1967067.1 hypothetical protein [Bradyrhizobium elkanii]MCS3523236.1 hypothetical protein [Bradyrhizobium elkanii]MCS4070891.1 hypothetical protein [Bradyrhizobium elkanii]MCS4077522.1 hypothetical protein [Bradyrhizobium elkanii]MCS4111428.1 hypothetical protein [Bradyrhizobium elkanii]
MSNDAFDHPPSRKIGKRSRSPKSAVENRNPVISGDCIVIG